MECGASAIDLVPLGNLDETRLRIGAVVFATTMSALALIEAAHSSSSSTVGSFVLSAAGVCAWPNSAAPNC